MAKTAFTGRIRSGVDKGNSTSTLGDVVLAQKVDVSADGGVTPGSVPAGSEIFDMAFRIDEAYDSTAQAVIKVGVTADEDYFGYVNVSAVGVYHLVQASGADWTISSDTQLVTTVTAVGTTNNGSGVGYIQYIRTS